MYKGCVERVFLRVREGVCIERVCEGVCKRCSVFTSGVCIRGV